MPRSSDDGKPAPVTGGDVERVRSRAVDRVPDESVERLRAELMVQKAELDQQQEELQRSHADLESALGEYQHLFDLAPIPYFVVTAGGSIRSVNVAGAQLVGIDRSRLPGLRLPAYVMPPDLGPFERLLVATLARSEEPCHQGPSEFRLRLNGGIRHVRVTASRLPAGQAQIPTALLAVEDVTERKRAEDALRNTEQRTRADLEAMERLQRVSSLFLSDGDLGPVLGEIVEAAIFVAGADFGDIQMLDATTGGLEIVAYRNFPEWWIAYWRTVDEGQGSCGTALQGRQRVIVEDVETSPIFAGTPGLETQREIGVRSIQSTPLLSRSGKPLGMFSTHWKRPGRPDDRTLGLLDVLGRQAADIIERAQSEDALRSANKQLLEADHRKDEFLAMLSHELRNPLAPIRNAAYILERSEPNGEEAERARGVLRRQSEHLARLVDDLLDATRITRGKISLQRSRLDLGEVVARAADDFRSKFSERGVAFRTVLPQAKVWTDADPTRTNQVITNLLHNATKFTRRGDEVTVTLAVQSTTAEIRVRDTGAGIDASLLPRLFEPFVQGDRTLARSEGGLGLGLALVKAIAELHGGRVHAESEGIGKGSEFVIELPLGQRPTANETRTEAARAGRGRRVLLVDDNQDGAETLADILRMEGHEVDVATDGPAALEKLKSCEPDVVLCDIGLPGMNGYEVAKAMRANGGRSLKLVALSGYAQVDDVRRAIEAGFDAHIAKPPDPQQLARLLS